MLDLFEQLNKLATFSCWVRIMLEWFLTSMTCGNEAIGRMRPKGQREREGERIAKIHTPDVTNGDEQIICGFQFWTRFTWFDLIKTTQLRYQLVAVRCINDSCIHAKYIFTRLHTVHTQANSIQETIEFCINYLDKTQILHQIIYVNCAVDHKKRIHLITNAIRTRLHRSLINLWLWTPKCCHIVLNVCIPFCWENRQKISISSSFNT